MIQHAPQHVVEHLPVLASTGPLSQHHLEGVNVIGLNHSVERCDAVAIRGVQVYAGVAESGDHLDLFGHLLTVGVREDGLDETRLTLRAHALTQHLNDQLDIAVVAGVSEQVVTVVSEVRDAASREVGAPC